jgi:hypothetical protein
MITRGAYQGDPRLELYLEGSLRLGHVSIVFDCRRLPERFI